jgi:oxygen-independent coproporphyrinogen III oxidase
MKGGLFGVYVHVPYCASLCPYCDFNSVSVPSPPWDRFTASLSAELDARASVYSGLTARSLYFGGGTPSLAPTEVIARSIALVRERVPIAADAEITVEANPGTVDLARLERLREMGVNRLSIGWQSSHDRLLRVLGRRHDARQSRDAVAVARTAGFANLSIDLIFAVPGQSLADLDADLAAVLALDVDHVSLYALTFHEDTDFWRRRATGELLPVGEELEADMMERIEERLGAAGYEHYEVSNYARPGRRAVHNTLYWTGANYLGLGPGAHSFFHEDWRRGVRWEGRRDPEAYYAAWAGRGWPGLPLHRSARTQLVERLSQRQLMTERFMCGLRFVDGVDLREPVFEGLMSTIAPGLESAVRKGWVTRRGSGVQPTPVGMRFGDALAALFF